MAMIFYTTFQTEPEDIVTVTPLATETGPKEPPL
jgi:hypothetical protein